MSRRRWIEGGRSAVPTEWEVLGEMKGMFGMGCVLVVTVYFG